MEGNRRAAAGWCARTTLSKDTPPGAAEPSRRAVCIAPGAPVKKAAGVVEKLAAGGLPGFSWRQRGTEAYEAEVQQGGGTSTLHNSLHHCVQAWRAWCGKLMRL